MSIATLIEIAIGVLSIWIVLSFFTILIQPLVSRGIREQVSEFELAIRRILTDPLLVAKFYDHPIIQSLTADKGKSPSHIPPQQFAVALFDIVMCASTQSFIIELGIIKVRNDLQKTRKKGVTPEIIEGLNLLAEVARSAAASEAGIAITKRTPDMLKEAIKHFVEDLKMRHPNVNLEHDVERMLTMGLETALNQSIRIKAEIDSILIQQPEDFSNSAIGHLRRNVIALSVFSPRLSQTLNALTLMVENYATHNRTPLGVAKKNVEKWFEDSISTKSDAIKRYSQALALSIGLMLALLFNIDSINMALYFWRDAAVREALVQNSSDFANSDRDTQALEAFSSQVVNLNLPIGWVISKTTSAAYLGNNCQLFPGQNDLFGIPFFGSRVCIGQTYSNNQTNLVLKLIGIFITAFAARQGAPFWFDLLKGLLNLRSAVTKPASSD
jgi:hypothetical protein